VFTHAKFPEHIVDVRFDFTHRQNRLRSDFLVGKVSSRLPTNPHKGVLGQWARKYSSSVYIEVPSFSKMSKKPYNKE
jgi:hypothetical protein